MDIESQQADNRNEDSTELPTDPGKLDVRQDDKLTGWKKEPTLVELKADLEYAREDNQNNKTNVDGWNALRDATGAEAAPMPKDKTLAVGRSRVQPKLVRKHNEWRYPALSEPFLNSDRMFEVKPRTAEDVSAAKQNQTLINWQFDTKMGKVAFIDTFVRTCVDEGTVIVRTGWERKVEKVLRSRPIYNYYEATDQRQVQMLEQAMTLRDENPPEYENLPEDLKASVDYYEDTGILVVAQDTGEEEDYHEEMVRDNHPSVKVIDTRNLFVDPSCEGVWDDAQFMIYTYPATKSDLKKRRIFKNLENVSWSANAVTSQLGNPDHETNAPTNDARVNKDKELVLVHEYWGLSDIHDTGEMVPVLISWIGDTIIQMEENPFPDQKAPFVAVPYMPVLKSVMGEADASLLADNQRIIGALTRGVIDLVGRSANAQTGYMKGALDPINRRRFNSGQDFEFNPNNDPATAIRTMTYPEIPNSAFQLMGQQSQEAESLTGVKSFAGGISGESYGKVARGISGAIDAAGMREMSILRRLAEGMRMIAMKMISMNGKFLEEEEVVRVTNEEFVKIRRDELEGNFDLVVDMSTAKVDEERSQDLGFMLQTMGPDMDPGLSKIILSQIANLKRMPDLAKRIEEYEPKPDPLEERLKELQIRKLEADILLDESRAAEATARAENVTLDTELEASGVKQDRVVQAQGAQARGNRDLEVTKEILKGETDPGNIEAAVGYNRTTEAANTPAPPPPPSFDLPQVLPSQELGPLQAAPDGQELAPLQGNISL